MIEKIKYIGFCIYIFGVPLFLYFFAQWDPVLGIDNEGEPVFLGIWPICLVFWILIFLTHKYNEERKQYRYALEKILELNRRLSVKEKIEIYNKVLDIRKWDINEDGTLKVKNS